MISMEELLHKMQNADPQTKMRLAIGLTVASMMVIVLVWLFYFNSLVAIGSPKTAAATTDTSEFSLWGSVKDGTALMYHNFTKTISNFGAKFHGSKQIDIQPQN